MSEFNSAVSELLKGKYPDMNLPVYVKGLSALYCRISLLRFSLNYYLFTESLENMPASYREDIANELASLQKLVKSVIIDHNETDATADLLALRESLVHSMDVLTSKIDRLQLSQYLMNRIEFRFKEGEYTDQYFNNGFEQDIYQYVIRDRDNQIINMKISRLLGELPMRLSRNKFGDLIRNAYSLYKDSEVGAVDDFTYRIRSSSCLYRPENASAFPRLDEYAAQFDGANMAELTKEQYEVLAVVLYEATDCAAEYSDLYVMLTNLVNDLICIAMTYNSLKELKETEALTDIISATYEVLQGERDADESIAEAFVVFEGIQEKLMTQIYQPESAMEEICNANLEAITNLGFGDDFDKLKKLARLQSGSTFAELEVPQSRTEIAGEIYVHKAVDQLLAEFDAYFDTLSTPYRRAVMACVIGNLPVYFNNLDEFMKYVHVSLSQCSGEAEKQATMSLIHLIMEEE